MPNECARCGRSVTLSQQELVWFRRSQRLVCKARPLWIDSLAGLFGRLAAGLAARHHVVGAGAPSYPCPQGPIGLHSSAFPCSPIAQPTSLTYHHMRHSLGHFLAIIEHQQEGKASKAAAGSTVPTQFRFQNQPNRTTQQSHGLGVGKEGHHPADAAVGKHGECADPDRGKLSHFLSPFWWQSCHSPGPAFNSSPRKILYAVAC